MAVKIQIENLRKLNNHFYYPLKYKNASIV